MIPNIKKSNIFSFGASVTVKLPSSLPSIHTFKMKSNLKHFEFSRMAPKRTIADLY